MPLREKSPDGYSSHYTTRGYLVIFGLPAALILVLVITLMAVIPAYSRYQARANANNRVKVSAIEIHNQAQRVQIAKQSAQIRYQNAIGVREAQDEIAKTLTPLYVQFEMVDALRSIAASGKNNSVVYIPAGANGIPLVSTLPGPVGTPQTGK